MRRLEQTIGLSRGAIFRHFRDKDTLFFELAHEDAERMADVASREGLILVMRNMLAAPEQFDWLATRMEIGRKLRNDPGVSVGPLKCPRVIGPSRRQRDIAVVLEQFSPPIPLLVSRPVEDCEGCPAPAGVRNLGLENRDQVVQIHIAISVGVGRRRRVVEELTIGIPG